jgi:hypothetical protein
VRNIHVPVAVPGLLRSQREAREVRFVSTFHFGLAMVFLSAIGAAAPAGAQVHKPPGQNSAEMPMGMQERSATLVRNSAYGMAAAAAAQMHSALKAAEDLADLLSAEARKAELIATQSAREAQAALLGGSKDYDKLQTQALDDQLRANRMWTDAEQATGLAQAAREAARAAETAALNALKAESGRVPMSAETGVRFDSFVAP